MHWSSSWWHAGGMWLFWLAVFAIVALAIYFTVRALRKSEPPRESPKEILQKRYARGEMTREDYERALEDLRQL